MTWHIETEFRGEDETIYRLLAQDGVVIDSNTGKVWEPPKRGRAPRLQIEPAKKRGKA